MMKTEAYKENKANSYILWDDTHSHNISVCGQYIFMLDL
jgi:hypothetical protein